MTAARGSTGAKADVEVAARKRQAKRNMVIRCKKIEAAGNDKVGERARESAVGATESLGCVCRLKGSPVSLEDLSIRMMEQPNTSCRTGERTNERRDKAKNDEEIIVLGGRVDAVGSDRAWSVTCHIF